MMLSFLYFLVIQMCLNYQGVCVCNFFDLCVFSLFFFLELGTNVKGIVTFITAWDLLSFLKLNPV